MLNYIKKLFSYKKTISLAVLYVEYDAENNTTTHNIFATLTSYLGTIKNCKITYFRVDNKHEGGGIKQVNANTYTVGGDNTFREFSGWQKGLEALNKLKIPCDVVLITNEMFLKPGPSFLQDYSSAEILQHSVDDKKVIGRIDCAQKQFRLFGYDVSSWICTNCFFVPKHALDSLTNFVLLGENISSILKDSYAQEHVLASLEITSPGPFKINIPLPPGPVDLRIKPDKFFLSSSGVPYSFICKSLNLNNQPFPDAKIIRGINEFEGENWVGQAAVLETPETTAPENSLLLEGFIPLEIFKNKYENQLAITIYNDSCLYQKNAQINSAYKRWLIEWLTERWHSKFEISQNTWDIFKTKSAAILNESLLTAKLAELGYKPDSYGDKQYY
nr:hypothetical protein [Desulfobulbaceae bacterium]